MQVLEQDIRTTQPLKLLLSVKFYPEDVGDPVQPITKVTGQGVGVYMRKRTCVRVSEYPCDYVCVAYDV